MPRLAARGSVALAAAVVVLTGLEALRVHHPYLSATPPATAEPAVVYADEAPRLGVARPLAAEPAATPPARRQGALAMARIHGRVVGDKAALDELALEVADATRAYEPRLDDDGFFEIHLPPGSYTLSATSRSLVAVADVAGLADEDDREVTLVLVPGAAIAGRVEGCDGPCSDVQVALHSRGARDEEAGTESDNDGRFNLSGLVPGNRYDLDFRREGMRRLTVRDVPAPGAGLVVKLAPSASLAGAFGLAPGEKCPMDTVTLTEPGSPDDRTEGIFDPHCRFEFDPLPDGDTVHLSANGTGWHFEVDVSVPAQGDPPLLCLHPPCREPEPEAKSSLTVTLQGVPSNTAYFTVEQPRNRVRSSSGCRRTGGTCVLEDLDPAPEATVEITAPGCEERAMKVSLLPGNNYLTYTCERTRDLQAVIRSAGGHTPVTDAAVRCSSAHPEVAAMGFVFHLRCPARLGAIEYRLGEAGPWRTAPVPSGDGAGLSFVDIEAG
jgi:hypothetical protein